jgi:hypothetical protein
MDSDNGDICNLSLGREILEAVQINDTKPKKRVSYNMQSVNSSTSEISASEIFDDMDDYLDEALEDSEESETPVRRNNFS